MKQWVPTDFANSTVIVNYCGLVNAYGALDECGALGKFRHVGILASQVNPSRSCTEDRISSAKVWECERRSSSCFSADSSSYAEPRVSQRPKFLPRDWSANKSEIIAKSFVIYICDASYASDRCLSKQDAERTWLNISWDINSTRSNIPTGIKENKRKLETEEMFETWDSCFTTIIAPK